MTKLLKILALLTAGMTLLGTGVAAAQTMYTAPNGVAYTVPAGYNLYGNGIYYNPSTGNYFNAVTGQISITPLFMDQGTPFVFNGVTYPVPVGFNAWGSTPGLFYSPDNGGRFYNAFTGQFSTTLPAGTIGPIINGRPAGYTESACGMYYNPTDRSYFDPNTGRYSSSPPDVCPTTVTATQSQSSITASPSVAYSTNYTSPVINTTPSNSIAYSNPVNPVVYTSPSNSVAYSTSATTPGLPNTGAGGNAALMIAMLALLGLSTGTCLALRRTWNVK
jgi:hypothetical protein